MSVVESPRCPGEGRQPDWRRAGARCRRIGRFLYTQNPFYLLSTAFVLHSTRLWYQPQDGPFDPWPLMGIICGYILVVAAVGLVLVRFGRVWDDARSIFLILLLLFVELSLTFDTVVMSQPSTGRTLLITGLSLAVVVSEGLWHGLRIRFPLCYRIPYHLFLALLFLYPLAIVGGLGDDTSEAVWRVYLFSPAAAVVLLTLLPAIRRGWASVMQTGIPWNWPWFPWGLFGFLTLCVGLRAYALSLSFDTVLMQSQSDAMRLDSAFGLYWLVPLLLAVALLLLEAGIVGRNRGIQRLALAIPWMCLVLSLVNPEGSAPYTAFLQRFVTRLGSPLWLSSLAGLAFLAYAHVRRVVLASDLFWCALLAAACISRTTLDASSAVWPQSWAMWIAAFVQGARGLREGRSWRVLAATLCLLSAVRSDFLIEAGSLWNDVLVLHLAGMAMLACGALFDDACAAILRRAGVLLLLAAGLCAAGLPAIFPVSLPDWLVPLYGAGVLLTAFVYAYTAGGSAYFWVGVANLCLLTGRLLFEMAGLLRRVFLWEGAGWFVWGLAWLGLGVLISARKAGLTGRLKRILPRPRHRSPALPLS